MVSRAPRRRKSAGGGAAAPPCPRAGALHSVRWAAGQAGWRRAGAGGGHQRSPHPRSRHRGRSPRSEPQASPARPSPGAASRRAGVCAAPRESESQSRSPATGPSNFAAGGAEEQQRGAAPGDGERAGRVGSGARARCFPSYK